MVIMKCEKCGQENQDNAKFCNSCGKTLSESSDSIKSNIFKEKIKLISDRLGTANKKKRIIILSASLVCCILLIGIVVVVSNPMLKFNSAVKSSDSAKATTIYNNKIKGDKQKEAKVEASLKEQITKNEEAFNNGKIKYDEAKEKLNNLKQIGVITQEIDNSLKQLDRLNNSKIAFSKAEEYLKQNDYVNAIKEYNLVISDDKNYEKANKQIEDNKSKYKENALNDAQKNADNNDYDKAVLVLNEATSILKDDNDIVAKLSVYTTKLQQIKAQEEEKNRENAKTKQLVVVDSAKVIEQSSRYKTLYPDMVQVVITNKANETVKNMEVSCLAYDSNGYPLKIKSFPNISGGNYELNGKADNINVTSGSQYGSNSGWNLEEGHGISTVKACVKKAIFYDGTTWSNPYYDYWIKEYKEKQLK
jgi:tetratricopeptide (TPR) repeat protein